MIYVEFFLAFIIVQDILLILLLKFNFLEYPIFTPKQWPKVSLFLPARNEEENLVACLTSLERIDYPVSHIEFILGNDQSEDQSYKIMKKWRMGKSNVLILEIKGQVFDNKINGKANALAQMAKHATGDYFLFTDADCQVNPLWVKSMVSAAIKTNSGFVTGITWVRNESFFTTMQNLDWVLTIGMIKVMADLKMAVTSMGNNMLIERSAYESIGGFENTPFSLTEDFEIAKSLRQKGHSGIHIVSNESLVYTEGKKDWNEFMSQRKRWMKGAMGLPFIWKILLGLQIMFFPFVFFLLQINVLAGLGIWIAKIIIQSYFLKSMVNKIGKQSVFIDFLVFETYYLFTSWMTFINFFSQKPLQWKGRKY